MKRFTSILLLLAALSIPCSAFSQIGYARRIVPGPALPATCNPGNGDVIFLTVGLTGMYQCSAVNTWSPVGLSTVAQQLNFTQGTIVLSTPFINQTATWNAGGVTFTGFRSVTTDTASAAGSLLFDWLVGANSIFSAGKAGVITTAAAGSYNFLARSRIASSADGLLSLTNAAAADFTRLNLGPVAVTNPGIARSAAVGGQTQGIIILKADGTAAVFGDLGAATNGSIIYCSDCTVAAPCAGGGTGALAKRLNGAWVCN